MTSAAIGYGGKYAVYDTGQSPPVWVDIGEVFNVTPPSFTADRIEATHMQSPNRTREYIPGLITPGAASFQMNFVAGSVSDRLIREMQNAATITQHRITFPPNNVHWQFTASIESYEPAMPTDDRMTATVNIIVSGSITEGITT